MFQIFPNFTEIESDRRSERWFVTEDGMRVRVHVQSEDWWTVRFEQPEVVTSVSRRPGSTTSAVRRDSRRPVRSHRPEGRMHFDRFGEPCGRF